MNSEVVLVYGARCGADHVLTPAEFSCGQHEAWPILCSRKLVEESLVHPGCGEGLTLEVRDIA